MASFCFRFFSFGVVHSICQLIKHIFSSQFRALSDQLYDTPENHKSVRRHIVNQVRWLLQMSCWFVELFLNGLFEDSHLSCLLWFILISSSLIQRFTRDMFLWHMMNIWTRCPGISLTFSFPLLTPFALWIIILVTLLALNTCHLHEIRSGEWGDHVTLQAAADVVQNLFLQWSFLFVSA